MTIDFPTLLERLAETGLEFVIVGGVAARLHGSTRVTHDSERRDARKTCSTPRRWSASRAAAGAPQVRVGGVLPDVEAA